MNNKKILNADKNAVVTRDGYVVSKWFCNTHKVRKQLNLISSFLDGLDDEHKTTE